jgi:hypothetical protein
MEVNTLLREWGIKPHLVKRFPFNMDKNVGEKLEDVVLTRRRTQWC